jgi:ParB-like nuclease domain
MVGLVWVMRLSRLKMIPQGLLARHNRNMNRPLTLEHIPIDLLAEYGLRPGGSTRPSYRSSDPNAVLVSLAEVEAPEARNLNEQTLRDLLRGIRDDAPISPVVVFREPGAATALLLDGTHRWRVSQALKFIAIPTIQPGWEDAELCYQYRRPNK